MALSMARPWKHPKTGVYWLRKGVPKELRALVGKVEYKLTLRTKEPAEAKRLHTAALADLEAQWAQLRERAISKPGATVTLSEREAHELAQWMYDFWLKTHEENPSEQKKWRTDLYERLWMQPSLLIGDVDRREVLDRIDLKEMEKFCFLHADSVLMGRDLDVTPESREKLARAIGAATQRASLELEKRVHGLVPWPTAERSATPAPNHGDRSSKAKVTLTTLLEGWSAEKRPAERTIYEWKRVLLQFKKFLGHEDAGKLAVDDVIRWKTSMVDAGLKAKTIRDAKLAPMRAILQWGADNRKIESNPAERVTIEIKQRPSESKRSFTDEEAVIILRAAAASSDPVKHWVPLLCAYSGARLSEVCQLRVEDVRTIDGVRCMAFDPEAGSLKTRSSERAVPLHPAVLDAGFLDFVKGTEAGPPFKTLPPDRFGKRGGNGTKVLGRWVRSLGLDDPRLSPNHSWRDRLRTLARRHGLAPDIVDAITGHSRKTVADSYGEFEMTAVFRELVKIPAMS